MQIDRILITGANGFVGRWLIRFLLSEDRKLLPRITACVQPQELAAAEIWGRQEFAASRRQGNIDWQGLDLLDTKTLETTIESASPEAICHLAARASGADTDREAVFRVNVDGTVALLEAARRVQTTRRVLLISTGYAYGNTLPERPARETDSLSEQGKFGAYTDSKIAMEQAAAEFHEIAVIARSFSHTGPGQLPIFAIPSFARQLARIEIGLEPPVIKVGNLDALRDMLDVRDVVRAYSLLLDSGNPGQVYNVSLGRPQSMRSMLDVMRSRCTVSTQVELDPTRLRPADLGCSTGDPERMHRDLAWSPSLPLEKTLVDTLDWWRKNARYTG